MPSNHLQNVIERIRSKRVQQQSRFDDADQEDLSYDDALLDVEIRSFMRAEYGSQRPPDGIFSRTMYAIRRHNEEQARAESLASKLLIERLIARMGQALAGAYRYAARPAAGRMISGGLITALLVLAVWPGLARSLANGGDLPLTFSSLTGTSSAAPADYLPAQGAVESATSTSAAPEISTPLPAPPVSPATSNAPKTPYMSPGRLYDDPRLMIAQRTGEDPNQLKKHSKQTRDGSTTDGSRQDDTDPYNRPVTGQF